MTYEYVCTACSHYWEAEQPISAAPLTTCPSCRKETAKRQVSGGQGFILKGGGWYADGYGAPAGTSKTEPKTASNGTKAATAATSGDKTETKSEAPKTDAPKTDAPKTDAPKTDTSTKTGS